MLGQDCPVEKVPPTGFMPLARLVKRASISGEVLPPLELGDKLMSLSGANKNSLICPTLVIRRAHITIAKIKHITIFVPNNLFIVFIFLVTHHYKNELLHYMLQKHKSLYLYKNIITYL